MPFDMGFNFRASSGYVTDQAYGVPALAEVYPHTYTNGNGYSINAGWDSVSGITPSDLASGNDPRIAGQNYQANNESTKFFKVDLSSGSAPGAGQYTVDLAFGHTAGGFDNNFRLQDTSTVLIDGTNGGSGGYNPGGAGKYIDATLAIVTASITWTGTTVSKTFATTLAQLGISFNNPGTYTTVGHFRLTLQVAGGSPVRRRLMMLGVGS